MKNPGWRWRIVKGTLDEVRSGEQGGGVAGVAWSSHSCAVLLVAWLPRPISQSIEAWLIQSGEAGHSMACGRNTQAALAECPMVKGRKLSGQECGGVTLRKAPAAPASLQRTASPASMFPETSRETEPEPPLIPSRSLDPQILGAVMNTYCHLEPPSLGVTHCAGGRRPRLEPLVQSRSVSGCSGQQQATCAVVYTL